MKPIKLASALLIFAVGFTTMASSAPNEETFKEVNVAEPPPAGSHSDSGLARQARQIPEEPADVKEAAYPRDAAGPQDIGGLRGVTAFDGNVDFNDLEQRALMFPSLKLPSLLRALSKIPKNGLKVLATSANEIIQSLVRIFDEVRLISQHLSEAAGALKPDDDPVDEPGSEDGSRQGSKRSKKRDIRLVKVHNAADAGNSSST